MPTSSWPIIIIIIISYSIPPREPLPRAFARHSRSLPRPVSPHFASYSITNCCAELRGECVNGRGGETLGSDGIANCAGARNTHVQQGAGSNRLRAIVCSNT